MHQVICATTSKAVDGWGLASYIAKNPGKTPSEYAAAFGKTVGWYYAVIASRSFADALRGHEKEITDPMVTNSMQERMLALSLHAVDALHKKLEDDDVDPMVVLKSVEASAKLSGLAAAQESNESTIDVVAKKIADAMEQASKRVATVIDVTATEVKDGIDKRDS